MSIEKAYNNWAAQYDTNENKTRDLDRKATIEVLSKYQFENVIELGCGTGKNTEWLVQKATNIICIDFSKEMVAKAKEKIVSDKVKFQIADITKGWKIGNNLADLVICNLVLEHIKDLDFIFKQAFQKLKSNGIFFISELHPFKQYTGSKAKCETENGIEELEVYVHHISEFISSAKNNGFKIIDLHEWFDEDQKEIPRLISLVFKK